ERRDCACRADHAARASTLTAFKSGRKESRRSVFRRLYSDSLNRLIGNAASGAPVLKWRFWTPSILKTGHLQRVPMKLKHDGPKGAARLPLPIGRGSLPS